MPIVGPKFQTAAAQRIHKNNLNLLSHNTFTPIKTQNNMKSLIQSGNNTKELPFPLTSKLIREIFQKAINKSK